MARSRKKARQKRIKKEANVRRNRPKGTFQLFVRDHRNEWVLARKYRPRRWCFDTLEDAEAYFAEVELLRGKPDQSIIEGKMVNKHTGEVVATIEPWDPKKDESTATPDNMIPSGKKEWDEVERRLETESAGVTTKNLEDGESRLETINKVNDEILRTSTKPGAKCFSAITGRELTPEDYK